MNKTFLAILVAITATIAGVLVYRANLPDEPPVSAPVAEPVSALEQVEYPAFTMNDIDGKPREFSEWSGRHRLLNFWATWCAPCRREIPLLKEFQAEQGDDGILIMGIAVDFPEEVTTYAEAAEFNYPILVGQEDAMALAESSGIQFIAMPFTMIVSREGQLLGAYLGELHREQLDSISSTLASLDRGEISTEDAKSQFDSL